MHQTLGFLLLFIAGSACSASITYTIENQLDSQDVNFPHSMQLETNNQNFYNVMLDAQAQNNNFQFTSKDYGEPLGHFITSVNKLDDDILQEKFWGFLLRRSEGDCKLPVGVSSYVAEQGDHVVLSYITFQMLGNLTTCY